ncbi:hypothetical protein AGMMS49965_10530 [Bacteroidia bacterium]|nr:hypothetical protein AGMMS49965_10530 [Bacteroidia bacterium]
MTKFKNVFLLAAIAVSAGFVGCNKEDDEEKGSSTLVGTWVLVHQKGYDSDYPGDTWDNSYTVSDAVLTMTFRNDGTVSETESHGGAPSTITGTWEYSGGKIIRTRW